MLISCNRLRAVWRPGSNVGFLKGLLRKSDQLGVNGFAVHSPDPIVLVLTFSSRAIFLVEGVIQLEKSE